MKSMIGQISVVEIYLVKYKKLILIYYWYKEFYIIIYLYSTVCVT